MAGSSRVVAVALVWMLASGVATASEDVEAEARPAPIELYAPALVSQPDTRAQGALDGMTRVFGVPFFALRAALVVPGATAGEIGNGLLVLLDRPAPGTLPHAEPGWLWNGAMRSLRDDWNESTPGR